MTEPEKEKNNQLWTADEDYILREGLDQGISWYDIAASLH